MKNIFNLVSILLTSGVFHWLVCYSSVFGSNKKWKKVLLGESGTFSSLFLKGKTDLTK